jgi:hypothetical protein
MKSTKSRFFPLSRRYWWVLAGVLLVVGVGAYVIHPVLAVTSRVDADILVVEGWVADAILTDAVQEFQHGHYRYLFTSGLVIEKDQNVESGDSYAAKAARTMIGLGIEPSSVIVCPTPHVDWERTSSSARAVREGLKKRGIKPKGINVVTAGPHGRETWVAYRHLFDKVSPIGIISIPNHTYDASHWWTSREGRRWVFKNIVGWTKEVLIGARS